MNASEAVLLSDQEGYSDAQLDASAALCLARAALAQGDHEQATMWLDMAETNLKRDANRLN